jgi:prepilin-type N-terminal cleavage/methylation domain-containing protein
MEQNAKTLTAVSWRSHSGMTMIELMVASFIAVIFMLAAGTGYLVNQKAYKANREKLELQQTASQVMELMQKNIRAAATATIGNPADRIQLFDLSGNEFARFRLNISGGTAKLFETDALLAQQKLILLSFVPNADTSSVTINLNLEDVNKNRVLINTTAALRNHIKMRNVNPNN